MKKLLPALALIPALALTPALVFAADNPDEDFFENAAQGGLAEVELGKLAQQKGTSAAVKEFAAMMVKDHSMANDKLKALATKKGVELPTKPGLTHMATKTKLEAFSGETFDKSYAKGMVEDHEDTIELFEKEVKNGKDADAKALATATLPTLRTHLQHAKALATKVGTKAD